MELQELISRARFIFSNAPQRLEVFKQVNGKKSAKEISKNVRRSVHSTLNDLKRLADIGLIVVKKDQNNKIVKKENSIVYEKIPLARQIPLTYYQNDRKPKKKISKEVKTKKSVNTNMRTVHVPKENEILDICRDGETQVYEFKTHGVEVNKITKEIAAFSNTKMGGILFYGVEDDGTIVGTDKSKQKLDQPIQNSIKNTMSPPVIVNIVSRRVLGQEIILICVPPWNRKDVYHYHGKVYVRKGTNCMGVTSGESKKLHNGEHIV